MIEKETLIYASLPYKKYRWISYISILQIGFIAINFYVLPTQRLIKEREEALEKRVRRKEKKDTSSDGFEEEFEVDPNYDGATVLQRLRRLEYRELFTIKNMINNVTERPLLSAGILTSMGLVTTAFCTYARRIVHLVTLLPKDRVRLAFHSAFAIGEPKSIELPVHHISCVAPRKSKHNYAILKIKNRYGFHLIHKAEGQFLEPKLYDKYLGFERSWAKKVG